MRGCKPKFLACGSSLSGLIITHCSLMIDEVLLFALALISLLRETYSTLLVLKYFPSILDDFQSRNGPWTNKSILKSWSHLLFGLMYPCRTVHASENTSRVIGRRRDDDVYPKSHRIMKLHTVLYCIWNDWVSDHLQDVRSISHQMLELSRNRKAYYTTHQLLPSHHQLLFYTGPSYLSVLATVAFLPLHFHRVHACPEWMLVNPSQWVRPLQSWWMLRLV